MKLPSNVTCFDAVSLFVWRPCGVLNEAKVDRILVFLVEQEKKFETAFNRFTDMSALDGVELSFKYVFHVSLYRRLARMGQQAVKSAFFVTDPKMARYVKLHALMTDYSPLEVAMFNDRAAAAKWLAVPVELLEASTL